MATVSSIYSRTGNAGGTTPPPSAAGGHSGSISGSGRVSGRTGSTTLDYSRWQAYANENGQVTSPPNYPDVSWQAYRNAGGSALGIGYAAWKDARLAAYNTAYNLYQQWYDSTEQQVSRINAAGLNTNLAYGMATPGSSPGGALAQSSGPQVNDVFAQGAQVLSSLFTNVKTLGEAANTIAMLPESRFKGKLAKQLDVAAAANAMNSEYGYLAQLNSARQLLGVGRSKAQREQSENAYESAKNIAENSLLDYMTSHDSEGSESDFESSLYSQGRVSGTKNQILEYQKNAMEWNQLLSKPAYYDAILQKMVNEKIITSGQAFQVKQILDDPNMDARSKYLALQPGLPGFLSKVAFSVTSSLIDGFNSLKNSFPLKLF